jgi:CDP-diacylglycerol--glycerol-3-phosphate 3-phosphatidyltransferase
LISVYNIKPAFQKLLQPLLKTLKKGGVTANQITLSAILLSIGMGIALRFSLEYPSLILVVPFGYLVRMMLNALDGMMATQYNMQSKLGEILNELGDVISDAVIIFPLIFLHHINPWVIICFGIVAILNEFAGVLAKAISGKRQYDGPMGKSDRALLIGVYCLTFYFWNDLAIAGNWVFASATVLAIVSTVIRLRNSLI